MAPGRIELTAAERLRDHHLVVGIQGMGQGAQLLAVDEKADVGPHPILFVDHATPDAEVAAIENHQYRSQGVVGPDLRRPGVGAQRSWDRHHCDPSTGGDRCFHDGQVRRHALPGFALVSR